MYHLLIYYHSENETKQWNILHRQFFWQQIEKLTSQRKFSMLEVVNLSVSKNSVCWKYYQYVSKILTVLKVNNLVVFCFTQFDWLLKFLFMTFDGCLSAVHVEWHSSVRHISIWIIYIRSIIWNTDRVKNDEPGATMFTSLKFSIMNGCTYKVLFSSVNELPNTFYWTVNLQRGFHMQKWIITFVNSICLVHTILWLVRFTTATPATR